MPTLTAISFIDTGQQQFLERPSPPPVVSSSTICLLCLPGLGGTGESFPVLPLVVAKAACAEQGVDIQAFAVTYGSTSMGSIPDMATAVWNAAWEAGFTGRVILVGYSMGGFVAEVMAAQAPDRTRGLVLVCTAAPNLQSFLHTWIPLAGFQILKLILSHAGEGLSAADPKRDRKDREACSAALGLPPCLISDRAWLLEFEAVVEFIAAGWGASAIQDVRRHSIPTLVIVGSNDRIIPMELTKDTLIEPLTATANAQFLIIRHADHSLPYTKAEEVGGAIGKWLLNSQAAQQVPR